MGSTRHRGDIDGRTRDKHFTSAYNLSSALVVGCASSEYKMFASFRIGTILGIPVAMNWSVLLVASFIAFGLAGQLLPAQVPGLGPASYWAAGAFAAVLFFGSLLAHELSHAIVARHEGLTVSGITLWLLGGVARMDGDDLEGHQSRKNREDPSMAPPHGCQPPPEWAGSATQNMPRNSPSANPVAASSG